MADAITCPRCGMTSHNPHDVREGYCGNCHDWTSVTGARRGEGHAERPWFMWCQGVHGRACSSGPRWWWQENACECPCHDRGSRFRRIPARWRPRLVFAVIGTVIITGMIALEWWAGQHGMHR